MEHANENEHSPFEQDKDIHRFSRRSFLKLSGGAAEVAGLAGGGWALTEIVVDEGPVASWHNSVCRYCGTGCSIMLGLDKAKNLVRVTTP